MLFSRASPPRPSPRRWPSSPPPRPSTEASTVTAPPNPSRRLFVEEDPIPGLARRRARRQLEGDMPAAPPLRHPRAWNLIPGSVSVPGWGLVLRTRRRRRCTPGLTQGHAVSGVHLSALRSPVRSAPGVVDNRASGRTACAAPARDKQWHLSKRAVPLLPAAETRQHGRGSADTLFQQIDQPSRPPSRADGVDRRGLPAAANHRVESRRRSRPASPDARTSRRRRRRSGGVRRHCTIVCSARSGTRPASRDPVGRTVAGSLGHVVLRRPSGSA